ncbi:MAG TPA: Xaa-Pro dipeptidase [Steroidobacteraceae bacterium]|nr:Xaa-Pro dipeptidase [Steroidobacteraceae bacterium]
MLASLFDDHVRIQRQRTDEAMATCSFDTLAIHAGSPHMLFLDDHPYPFKPNPHFKLWVPLEGAVDCWLLYRPGEKLRLIFLQPADYWHKPPSLPTGFWTRHFQIEVIREPGEARRHLTHLGRCAFIGEWQEPFADWGFAESNPEELLHRLHYPRAIKTEYELECMRHASHAAARGHVAAEAAFRAGKSEYKIHMAYVRATGHTERDLPYSNIVALNTNASVLHYQHQEREAPAQHYSFLIDAGAQFHTYAADVTRTYAAADGDFAALIAGMESLQLHLCAQVRSGVDYARIHLDAHMRIAALLHEAGVITLSAADAVTSGLSGVFFPHGVGHLLGLQVHDVAGFSVDATGKRKAAPPGHPYLRLTRTLEPGFVVTIEPGLYFIDMLLEEARKGAHGRHIAWRRVEEFRPYGGIRVEDNVACTADAPENLTRNAFAALA